MKDGYTKLEKAKENQKELKSDLNEIVRGRNKSEKTDGKKVMIILQWYLRLNKNKIMGKN